MEQVNNIDEIQHSSVRETLRFMNIKKGVEINHDGDLPARTGLGSSSSFTVGLIICFERQDGNQEAAIPGFHIYNRI